MRGTKTAMIGGRSVVEDSRRPRSAGGRGDDPPTDGEPDATGHASPGGESILLERRAELSALDDLVRDAVSGTPAFALIEGSAGIGKSQLIAEAGARAAAAGMRVLSARAGQLEQDLPFGVVRQLFDPILADSELRARWITGAAGGVSQVFAPPEDDDDEGDTSFRVLYALFWLVVNVAAERPVLISVDDLHWCDRGSLRFIAYLERRLSGLPVLLVASVRSGDAGERSRLLAEIAHDPVVRMLRPRALSEGAVAELVSRWWDGGADPRFSRACHVATGGNPLLLGELLRGLRREGVRPDASHLAAIGELGPRAVSWGVLARLTTLPPDAASVAAAIAFLGDGADVAAVAAMAQIDEPRTVEAIRALVHAELLRPDTTLGFVHPLVRDVVYQQTPSWERTLAHERAARVLADLGAGPEQVAPHLVNAPRRGEHWVSATLREAGRAARRRGDTESAISYLRRALDEPPPDAERPHVLFELGRVEAGVDVVAASEHMRRAYDGLTDASQRTAAATVLLRMLMFMNAGEDAARAARRTIADLPGEDVDQRRWFEALELYAVAFGAVVPDAPARLAAARADQTDSGVGARLLSAVAAWDWVFTGGSAEQCAAIALHAVDDGTLVAADPFLGAVIAGNVLVLTEKVEALDLWDATMREAQRLGSRRGTAIIEVCRGWTWLEHGELVEAEQSLRTAFDQIGPWEGEAGTSYVAAHLARVLLERGDVTGARAALERYDIAPGALDGALLMRRSVVELLLAEQDWERALAEADALRSQLGEMDNPAWVPWRSARARALDGLGHHDEAVALMHDEVTRARSWGAPAALGRSLRWLGTMTGGARGLHVLQEGALVTGRSLARLEHAKMLVSLGSALHRAGRTADARMPLRNGLEIAWRCGAAPLAEHARAELRAAGGRPRRDALRGPQSLTPSEKRIARMAAAGRTNRSIARELYVTPKTVEIHLTSVYRKLGVASRTALPDALSAATHPGR